MKRMVAIGLVITVLGSGVLVAGPALDILGELAAAARSERLIAGYTTIGVGAAVAVASAVFLADSEIAIYGIVAGGVIAVPGLITLAVPSAAERAFASTAGSETAAALALERMAAEARFERILSGVLHAAAGAASLFFPYQYFTPYDYLYSAISSFGLAAYEFLFPSQDERAYKQYRLLVEQEAVPVPAP
ncbi:MAG: hypothetical protein JSW65_03350 [Candidatus Bipolaricaulota bacterium]|nr:MAG: hypothetical protein JSW65_03350 [Candidatus Bipolaricaulota bacterium]